MPIHQCKLSIPFRATLHSFNYQEAQTPDIQTARTAAPPNSRFPAALVGEVVEDKPVALGVPVPDAELVVEALESVPLAFANLPEYLVCWTPLPFVHSEAMVLVLEKVMSAHCPPQSVKATYIGSFPEMLLV